MVQISRQIRVTAPLHEVWQVLADFPNIYKWVPAIKHSHSLTAQTRGVGAERTCRIRGFGTITERVLEWDEGHGFRYEWRTSGPVRLGQSRWTLSPEGENVTVVSFTGQGELRFGPLGQLLWSVLVRRRAEKLYAEVLAALRHYVETGRRQRNAAKTG